MRTVSAIALSSLFAVLGFACSSSSSKVAATGDAGADASTPQKPEDVPAVAIAASTDTDCPDAYKSKAPAAGKNTGFLVDGQQREFYVIEPTNAPSGPVPVFVAFNGTGEDGESFAMRAKLQTFADRGMLVLAPSSIGNGELWPVWDSLRPTGKENDPNKDVDYFDTLLKCAAAHRPIDKNRVYVGGHSAGGIFTNTVIQRRSQVVAGAVVASGILSQTSPNPPADLDKMLVLVTWGGDNDAYTGKAGTADVNNFSFVPEASKASKFYASQRNVGQANCHGANIGHAWLDKIDNWMVDLLLAHPKGLPGNDNLQLADVPAGSNVTCTTTPFDYQSSIKVTCPSSTRAGCQEACQLFGDCAVANATVSGVLSAQLQSAGFSGTDNADCGGCVTRCASKATTPDDDAVMTCMKTQETQNDAQCGPGIDGAKPLINAINTCCAGKTSSGYCKDICGIIKSNSVAINYFGACQGF